MSDLCLGYGVFVGKEVKRGEFLAEFCGQLMDYDTGDGMEDEDQPFIYYFNIKSNKYW